MDETFESGRVIAGKFRIERELGRGGMSAVYLAHHLKLGTPLALKVMLPEFKGDTDAAARFLREARAMARMTTEHVVRVLDIDVTDGGQPYIAMEYVEGADLARVLHQRERLPFLEAAEYISQAALALSDAHALGIVHRDLKPANLLLTSRRDRSALIKVLDFGISKVPLSDSVPQITRQEISMGTPNYMSPEQLRASSEVGPATDIWALGVLLYQLVTGKLPFVGDTMPALCLAIMEQPVPEARAEVPDLPPAIDAIIQRCLRRSPAERFESVEALRDALSTALGVSLRPPETTSSLPAPISNTTGAHSIPFVEPNARGGRRRRWAAVGAGVIPLLIFGGYWSFTRNTGISDSEALILQPTFGPRSFPPTASSVYARTSPPPVSDLPAVDAGVDVVPSAAAVPSRLPPLGPGGLPAHGAAQRVPTAPLAVPSSNATPGDAAPTRTAPSVSNPSTPKNPTPGGATTPATVRGKANPQPSTASTLGGRL